MSMQIRGSVCFVTGSNRGIGRAIVEELIKRGAAKVYASAHGAGGAIGGAAARAFARQGAKVFLAGPTLAKLEAAA